MSHTSSSMNTAYKVTELNKKHNMHVTIYLFCYLCIYYMLILFSVLICNGLNNLGSMEQQAHTVKEHHKTEYLLYPHKTISYMDMNRAKACYTVLCTIDDIVSQCHVCECIG